MGSGSSAQSSAARKAVEVPSLKISVVGDPQVGKTSILTRYIHNQFSPVYVQTHKAAIDNVVRKLNVPGHAKVPITFWDIPGHEDLPLHSSYFTDLDAVIVVVDMTIQESLESAILWRQTVLGSASFTCTNDQGAKEADKEQNGDKHMRNIEDIPFLLLGNKLDLCTKKEMLIDDQDITSLEKSDTAKEHLDTGANLDVSDRVQQLEEIASRGFVGSVAVSALNNDLSVHAAIQAFLRHLLEKRSLVQRRGLARPLQLHGEKQAGRPRYSHKSQLKPVGIQEIDAEFSQAEAILYRVSSLQRYQDDSLQKFSSQCVEAGVIHSSQEASMQNCLVALRDKLAEQDLKLQLKLDDFCHLEVKASKEDAELNKDLRYAIKTFNKEYAAVTRAILAEFPVAETKLALIESQVNELCKDDGKKQEQQQGGPSKAATSPTSKITNPGGGPPPGTVTRIDVAPVTTTTTPSANSSNSTENFSGGAGMPVRAGAVVEKNRAVLRHAARECHDCLAHIQRSVKQAKAAFVW